MMMLNNDRDNDVDDKLALGSVAVAIKNQKINDVGGVATTAAGQLNALLDQLTIISQQPTDDKGEAGDAARDVKRSSNDAIVDQLFEFMLGRVGGPKTGGDFGFLEAFGVELASIDKSVAAHACFERLLQLQNRHDQPHTLHRLRTAHNLDNVRHRMVERWHFRMLNDRRRNAAYRDAIRAAVQRHLSAREERSMRVLDIGTGTGLLAMYAHAAGATDVYACEQSALMASLARQTFERNVRQPSRRPQLIEQHSTMLSSDDLDGERVDLIVTETLDAGAFGEGILQTLQHAHRHLLRKPTGRIIPSAVQLYVAGFESRLMAIEQVDLNGDFGELVYMRGSRLRASASAAGRTIDPETGDADKSAADDEATDDDSYDSENCENIRDFKLITRIEPALAVDFESAADVADTLSGAREKSVRLEYIQPGGGGCYLDGFVVWFRLQLDAEHHISTQPTLDPNGGGVADATSSAPESPPSDTQHGAWEQAIFRLNKRFSNEMARLKYLNVTMSCAGGRLRLRHFYDDAARLVLCVPPDTVRFVNDAVYLTGMEYELARVLGADRQTRMMASASTSSSSASSSSSSPPEGSGYVLDLCPFPHIGFGLLKDGRAQRLYCSAAMEPLMRFVAAANCISVDRAMRFVDDLEDVWQLPTALRFDVIVLAPLDGLGVLDAEMVRSYGRLRAERLLQPGGRILPHKLEMWGYLVKSEWLRRMTSVVRESDGATEETGADGDELFEWGIAQTLNRFATRQQLGLGLGFEQEILTKAFRVAVVRWGENVDSSGSSSGGDTTAGPEEEERYVMVRLLKEVAETDLHALVCFYAVWMLEESTEPVLTRRYTSHVRRICFMLQPPPEAMNVVAAPIAPPTLPTNVIDADMCTVDDCVEGEGDSGCDPGTNAVTSEEEGQQTTAVLAATVRRTSRAVVHVRQHDGFVECGLYRRGQGGNGRCAVLNGE